MPAPEKYSVLGLIASAVTDGNAHEEAVDTLMNMALNKLRPMLKEDDNRLLVRVDADGFDKLVVLEVVQKLRDGKWNVALAHELKGQEVIWWFFIEYPKAA